MSVCRYRDVGIEMSVCGYRDVGVGVTGCRCAVIGISVCRYRDIVVQVSGYGCAGIGISVYRISVLFPVNVTWTELLSPVWIVFIYTYYLNHYVIISYYICNKIGTKCWTVYVLCGTAESSAISHVVQFS